MPYTAVTARAPPPPCPQEKAWARVMESLLETFNVSGKTGSFTSRPSCSVGPSFRSEISGS